MFQGYYENKFYVYTVSIKTSFLKDGQVNLE